MRLGPVAVLLLSLVLCLPASSAQVPAAPDPSEAVELACATAGDIEPQARDLVPVCARAQPQPPAAPEAGAEAEAPSPQTVPELATEILDDAKEIPNDPASAPDRLLIIVATVVQFVEDLLAAPGAGLDKIEAEAAKLRAAITETGREVVAGAQSAAASAKEAAKGALDKVLDLFSPAPARELVTPKIPGASVPKDLAAKGLVDRVASIVP